MDVAAALRQAKDGLCEGGAAPGRGWCRAWSGEVDAALTDLAAGLRLDGHLTVVAVGGYGRRELCPCSDVDLLLLHDGLDDQALEGAVRQLVYPLWDAGLKVGYAVRDGDEAVARGTDDVDSTTALLDGRPVAGGAGRFRRVRDAVVTHLRRHPGAFLKRLAAADIDRRRRLGDAAEVLEPHVKGGAGGLRDVQSLRWAAAALLGRAALDPLVPAGYLGAPDRTRLAQAYERLLATRVALHLETGRPGDTLRLELQDPVGDRLGYGGDQPGRGLLHDLFLAARTVDHVGRRAWTLLVADAERGRRRRRRPAEERVDGFGVVDGVLTLPGADLSDPELPTRLLAALTSSGAVLDRGAAADLRRVAAQAPWRWTDGARRRFLATLWRGPAALPALAELDDAGVLTALVPEWEDLRGRPQRNPFHRYSLDRHAWHAAVALAEVVREEVWAVEELERVTDREGLMLGVLLHDVGKAHGEPHSETGVPVARAVAERMGASPGTVDLVGRLTRLHLLLPDTATRRDLSDPGLAAAVAAEVGSEETLACLHLLAAADGRATGPRAWSSWKASLVATLVRRVRSVLRTGEHDAAATTAREAQDLARQEGLDPARIRVHLALLPSRYAAAVTPATVVRHAALADPPPGPEAVRTRVTAGEVDRLDLVAADRPGLVARVAGVLTLHRASVLSAHAFTRSDGLAVDTFSVAPPPDAPEGWWEAVREDLVGALAGRLALRARVARKAGRAAPADGEVPTRVEVSPDTAGQATLVEVRTRYRPGVLFAAASALAELDLDIVAAKVTRRGPEAVDAFYVRDTAGALIDGDLAREVTLALKAALAEG